LGWLAYCEGMLTRDGKALAVLEDLQIDYNLPKHKKARSKGGINVQNTFDLDDEMSEDGDDGGSVRLRTASNVGWGSRTMFNHPTMQFVGNDGLIVELKSLSQPAAKPTALSKLAFWRKPKPVLPEPEPERVSVQEFFASVKNSAQEIAIVVERAVGYELAMTNAKKAGQEALFEKLAAGINAFRMETQLVAMGLTKFVSEEDIVRFYKQSQRGLRLDYVRNFARTIPETVVALKTRADELGIFDAYVVLHYDPNAKSFAETEKEKAARKDPILFGLMSGRRVLYFVGDWVDELCDLTLDQIAETLGKDAVKSIT
jgi:hypothetical protein